MGLSKNRIAYLLEVYSDRKATQKEEQELLEWVMKGNKQPIKEHIEKLLSDYNQDELVPAVNWEQLYERIQHDKTSGSIQPMVPTINWNGYAAAACLLLATTFYFILCHNDQKKVLVSQIPVTHDITPPSSINAVLTLSNGRKIILDKTGTGTLANQGAVKVIKLADGQITYHGSSNEIQYNTLTNPRGSKVINLTLSDGSKVWLNAESALTYPTAFSGNERKVKITGEAYFEVAHNPAMPFTVSKGGTNVRVFGTHFNVNAYDNENSIFVTLLEGRVSVSTTGNQPMLLKQGEQAKVDQNGVIRLNRNVDVDEVMAWKNGLFSYKGSDVKSIMRQVARWYNVQVIIEKPVNEKFYAEVSRNTSISTLMKMLKATKALDFKIEGKTIWVTGGSP